MLVCIADVLTKAEVDEYRVHLDQAPDWETGLSTAGAQAAAVKNNRQMPLSSALAQQLGDQILRALSRNATFMSAALPLKILPPMFNRYCIGEHFGIHVDNAIRSVPGTPIKIRTDLSCTLFLTEPEDYDGGELIVEDHYGAQEIKLPAGHLVLYPSTSLHMVEPVTRGERIAAFFWLQSMIRSDQNRSLLFDFDQTIQELTMRDGSADPHVVRLSGIYHNLIRTWADT